MDYQRDDDEAGRLHRSGRNRQRQRVLELVREHDEPIDAAELAAHLGLHTTTVRFHLDALCGDGVVERSRITRAGVGRPRTGYRAVRERLDYRSLAEILALELGDTVDERRRRAEAVGRRWAERVRGAAAAPQQVPDRPEPMAALEQQAAMVAKVFDRMGFGPELRPPEASATGNQRSIELHSCPVRDLARAHPEVACAMHRGMLRGLLANTGAREGDSAPRAMQAELESFVEPDLCLVRVIGHD